VLTRAAHRLLGTFAGLVVAAGLLGPGLPPWAVAAVAALLLWPTELFMTRHYAIAIGFFTPLIMVMTMLAEPEPTAHLLVMRALDTVLGVAAGVAVALLVRGRRRPLPPARTVALGPAVRSSGSSDGIGAGTGGLDGL